MGEVPLKRLSFDSALKDAKLEPEVYQNNPRCAAILGNAGSSGSDIMETVDPIRSESQLPHKMVNLWFTFTN
jgi:hypothetical protein